MLTESELKSEVRAALAEVTPPAPWLSTSIERTLRSRRPKGWTDRAPYRLRIGLRFAAALVLITLALATTAVFLVSHHAPPRTVPVKTSPTSPQGAPWAGTGAAPGFGMVSPTTGWRGSFNGYISRTTDGGAHWTGVTPPLDLSAFETAHFFLDATHAWVIESVGTGPQLTEPLHLFTFRTDDGGNTWAKGAAISANIGSSSRPRSSIPSITGPRLYFLDPLHGWLLVREASYSGPNPVESDALYGTQDGGLHWKLLAMDSKVPAAGCTWSFVSFASANDGWLTIGCNPGNTGPFLLVTHDGGVHWSAQQLPLAAASVSCPCSADTPVFFDGIHGVLLVGGSALGLFVTSDGGNTWSSRGLPGEWQRLVDFIDPNHGWAIAGPQTLFIKDSTGHFPSEPGVALPLYRTSDGGLTWVPVRTSLPLDSNEGRVFDVYFVDQNNGFADRFSVATQQGQLLKTTDGGQTWTVVGPAN